MNIKSIIKNIAGKPSSSFEEKAIDKGLKKNKSLDINLLTSERTFTKNDEGSYIGGEMTIGRPSKEEKEKMEKEHKAPKTLSIPSTAISKVRYDPEQQICWVKYRSGKEWYSFSMTPEEFKAYMAAPSKGRHTQKMRKTNYDSNWKEHKL